MPEADKKNELIDKIATFLPIMTVLLAIVYAVAAYVLLFLPKLSEFATSGGKDLERLELRVAEDERYSRELENQIKSFRKLNPEKKAKVSNVMPLEPSIPELFVQYQAIAAKNGFVLDSAAADIDDTNISAAGRLPIRVSMSLNGGSYKQFKYFLADLEANLRISDIRSMLFTPKAAMYNIVLDTYFYDRELKYVVTED